MPIYLEEVTAPALPRTHMDAMLHIANAAIGKVVTPGVAMQLLREHLVPVAPTEAHSLFETYG